MPKRRDACIESEVMILSLPMSRVIEVSFLRKVNNVDHAVWAFPSMRFSAGKNGRVPLDAVTERGCSFTGSLHDDSASLAMVVVVVIGSMLEVDDDG